MDTVSDIEHKGLDELKRNTGWFLALGIGLIILGTIAIFVPLVATFTIENVIGLLFIIGGIMHIVHAFRWRTSGSFLLDFIPGALYLVFGILLLAYPLTGVLTLTLFLAVFFLVEGVFKLIQAYRMRTVSRWGWMVFSGVVSLILGFIILLGLPLTAFWAIGLIVGIDLIFGGWTIVMLSTAVRSAVRKGETFCIGGECYSM
jgi:uncharacterized membrane protein HdeD (DUF308 family)